MAFCGYVVGFFSVVCWFLFKVFGAYVVVFLSVLLGFLWFSLDLLFWLFFFNLLVCLIACSVVWLIGSWCNSKMPLL